MGDQVAVVAAGPATDCADVSRPAQGTLPVSTIDARYYLERWVRWAFGARIYGRSTIGKLMDGLRSTTCATCRGRKRVEGWKVGSDATWVDPCPACSGEGHIRADLGVDRYVRTVDCTQCLDTATGRPVGEVNGRTCFRCRGAKRYTIVREKVNPAGIRATRHHGANQDDDPVSAQIDRLVAGWRVSDHTVWLYEVVMMEYSENGTQAAKARSMWVSTSFYEKKLKDAHGRVSVLVDLYGKHE